MQYQSQKVAYPYFALALLLFMLQVLVGLWLAINYFVTLPQSLVNASFPSPPHGPCIRIFSFYGYSLASWEEPIISCPMKPESKSTAQNSLIYSS